MQTDLFAEFKQPENLLPCDGEVYDHGLILSRAEADACFAALLADTPWQADEAMVFGKHIRTARAVAWYGDGDFAYAYSGITRHALPWSDTLLHIKHLVDMHSNTVFNACLLNLYHHGGEGMGWHSDNETVLGRHTTIASLSLGASRRFCFKHRSSGARRELLLQHGQLLLMCGSTQEHWLHRLPPMAAVTTPRINLTFRTYRGHTTPHTV